MLTGLRVFQLSWFPEEQPPRLESLDNMLFLIRVAAPREFKLVIDLPQFTVSLDDLRNVLAVNNLKEVEAILSVFKISTDSTQEIS